MKNLILTLCLCFAFCAGLRGEGIGRGNWSWKMEQTSLSVTFRLPGGCYAYAEQTKPLLTPEAVPVRSPESKMHKDSLSGEDTAIYHGPGEFTWVYSTSALTFPLKVAAEWQVCLEETPEQAAMCLMPGDAELTVYPSPGREETKTAKPGNIEVSFALPEYKVLRSVSGYLPAGKFLSYLTGDSGFTVFSFAGRGFLTALLLAFLGGTALNLTPCVLPLIPVNLAVIGAGAKSTASRKMRILRGVLYGAGIAFTYGLLGCIAVLTGTTFGQLDSNWIFHYFTAMIFVFLGLAMFDVFRLDLSSASSRIRMPSAAHGGGVFLMGALSAVLAGACVAPVIAAALLQASGMAAAGNYAGLLLPFFVGLGMALPWPFLAAGIALLPKPGAWMNHVKHVLGILILLLACYYIWTGSTLLIRSEYTELPAAETPEGMYQKVADALTASSGNGQKVLLDFGASWCKACAVMDADTLKDPAVQEELNKMIFVKINAEDPSEPLTAALLKEFQVTGFPAFVLLEAVR